MRTELFAADDCFYLGWAGRYSAKSRVEMLKELGYAGLSVTMMDFDDRSWAELPALLALLDSNGLALNAISFSADVAAQPVGAFIDPRVPGALQALRGRNTLVQASLYSTDKNDKPSSPRGDPRGVEAVKRLADLTDSHGLRLSLNPQGSHWLSHIEDAVRVLMRVNRDDIGITFNLRQWVALNRRDLDLASRLELVLPRLCHVELSGVSYPDSEVNLKGLPLTCLATPLDQGRYDVFICLGLLERAGYGGHVTLDGFGFRGDTFGNLRRSMAAWRDLCGRVARHADWSRLDPPMGQ